VPQRIRHATARGAILLTAAIVSAFSIAGCGGASQGRLSARELAAKGDAICERLKEALNAADREAGWYSLAGRAKLSVLFAAAEERASNQLARLKPAASAESEWQQVVASRRALLPYHRLLTKYASHGEAKKLEATYKAYKVVQRRMQEDFRHSRFGFKICWDIG
jgi:hypothetical protein